VRSCGLEKKRRCGERWVVVGGLDDGASLEECMRGILICTCVSIGPSSAAANRGASDVEVKAVRRPPRGIRLALYHSAHWCQ
jgi:hypothetical protein